MIGNNFQIDSAAVTDKGLSEKRPQNEDSYLEMNERGLFVVADGVGGAQAGDVASQMAVKILDEAFVDLPKNGDAEEAMKIAIERANKAIFQKAHELPQLATMATTVVALHVAGNIATIGHVGDSRLYRLDAKKNLYQETQDHSVVEEEVRAGRMTAAQAAHHPSRNVISRALGAELTVEVDLKTIMFEPHTTFLLCSDGITRHIDDPELREILLSDGSPANVVRKLKEICYERGAEDNLTAVVARVTDKIVKRTAKSTKGKSFADSVEPTAATVHSPLAANSTRTKASIIETGEIPTQPLQIPVVETVQTPEPIKKTEIPIASTPHNKDSSSFHVQTSNEKIETVISKESEIRRDVESNRITKKKGSGAFGKFLASLLLLLLGAVLGAGAIYFWVQNYIKPTNQSEIPPVAPPAISYSAFEASRRSLDKNPQVYIETNVLPPEKAEEFYLVGRAYLLTGKYTEAKKSFEEAKNRLAQVDEASSKTLANEIAMSLAIINDPEAQKTFEKDLIANIPNANISTSGNFGINSENTNR